MWRFLYVRSRHGFICHTYFTSVWTVLSHAIQTLVVWIIPALIFGRLLCCSIYLDWPAIVLLVTIRGLFKIVLISCRRWSLLAATLTEWPAMVTRQHRVASRDGFVAHSWFEETMVSLPVYKACRAFVSLSYLTWDDREVTQNVVGTSDLEIS